MQYITLLSSDHRVYRKNSTEIPAPYRKKAPNPFGFEVSIIQCRRWEVYHFLKTPVKSRLVAVLHKPFFTK